MKIVIAPNALKGSLTASKAAQAIAEGLVKSRLSHTFAKMPIADGGDGTAQVLVDVCGGEMVSALVADPLGREITAEFGLIDGGATAIINMAAASGVSLLATHELNPMLATSFGTGLLIIEALQRKVSHIIIALGGSATVDGGLGILQALGLEAKDSLGNTVSRGGKSLADIASIDKSQLQSAIEGVKFTLLCDVDNKLLGENGAAKVFGPQKGATQAMIDELEVALAHFAMITKHTLAIDVTTMIHGGAAGGAGAFLAAYLNAEVLDGASFILQKAGLDDLLATADVLITAEGRIDEQTLHGKGPHAVALRAKEVGLTTIALAGQVAPDMDSHLFAAFDAIIPIANGPAPLSQAMSNTYINIVRTSEQLGNLLHSITIRHKRIAP